MGAYCLGLVWQMEPSSFVPAYAEFAKLGLALTFF